MSHGSIRPALTRCEYVRPVEPEPCGMCRGGPLQCVSGEWQYKIENREHEVVDGKDAQRAARIERTKIVFVALGIEQDASDQETREHEEEVDADPRRVPDGRESAVG